MTAQSSLSFRGRILLQGYNVLILTDKDLKTDLHITPFNKKQTINIPVNIAKTIKQ